MGDPDSAAHASAPNGSIAEDLIFDAGAHKGEDTNFYLLMGYRVVAIEANPDLASELRARFRGEAEDGRLIVVDKAIAPQAGEGCASRNGHRGDA